MLRESVAGVARSFGHGYYMQQARDGGTVPELWKALGEKGFLGVSLPEEYGGGGLGVRELAIVAEELAAAGCPMPPLVFSQSICGSVIAKYGTGEQREKWLGGIASGDLRFSFAITEPDAGSNSHNISTSATRSGDGWVVNGSKTYISGIEAADAIMVVVRSGRRDDGRGLLSLLVVDPDAPGLEKQHIPTAVGMPDQQWGLFFDDVKVGAENLVGEEHKGLKAIFDGLNPERILAAAMCIGIARFGLEKATRYVNERAVWGVPIGSHQGVAHPLAEARIELEAARVMTDKAARLYDAGLPAGETANMAKFIATEAGIHCLDQAIQVHGGNGVALEYELTDLWWLLRLMRIAPVSREMVLNFVAEHTLGLPKSY
jgi:alkylation response protein AidB-like acyl-CoA dehydrogenase